MRIVVKQVSGLGNQLFQYAAGRYYAERYGAELRVAFDAVQPAMSHNSFPRPLLLQNFSLTAPIQSLTQIDRAFLSNRFILRRSISPIKRMLRVDAYAPPFADRYRFLPVLPVTPGTKTLYILGYWQCYPIVDGIAAALRRELALREPAQGKNLDVMKQIHATPNAVSLHIRRGDYTLAAEGNIALPMSFYRRAMALMRERVADPTYFVFSDDIKFARQHLPAEARLVFVDHNDDYTAHEDLRLMASCNHHIIANSTFSWWGAWLNPRADKQVIAPRHWHLTADSFQPELLPPSWTPLDSIREV